MNHNFTEMPHTILAVQEFSCSECGLITRDRDDKTPCVSHAPVKTRYKVKAIIDGHKDPVTMGQYAGELATFPNHIAVVTVKDKPPMSALEAFRDAWVKHHKDTPLVILTGDMKFELIELEHVKD